MIGSVTALCFGVTGDAVVKATALSVAEIYSASVTCERFSRDAFQRQIAYANCIVVSKPKQPLDATFGARGVVDHPSVAIPALSKRTDIIVLDPSSSNEAEEVLDYCLDERRQLLLLPGRGSVASSFPEIIILWDRGMIQTTSLLPLAPLMHQAEKIQILVEGNAARSIHAVDAATRYLDQLRASRHDDTVEVVARLSGTVLKKAAACADLVIVTRRATRFSAWRPELRIRKVLAYIDVPTLVTREI